MAGYQNDPGTPQQEAGFGYVGRFWTESFNNLTAKAGGGIVGATPIDSMYCSVTVATAGDSVILPDVTFFPGGALIIEVSNISGVPMQVFAQGSNTINGQSGSTGLSQMGNSIVYYQCTKAGTWQAVGLGAGFATGASGAMVTYSTSTGITAHAGGGQANAVLLTAMQNQVSVCATGGDSVRLPPAQPGMELTVVNNGAQSCNVFASSQAQGGATGGDSMNGTQNASSALAAASVGLFFCFVVGLWVSK
jgi:hypothetical protein